MEDGNPFLGDRFFVGRLQELSRVRKYLDVGQSVVVIGGRRCGKTALLKHIGELGRRVLHLDAGAWRIESEAEAIESIGHQLGVPCGSRRELQDLLEDQLPATVLIDECDRILTTEWAESFLAYLRFFDGTRFGATISFGLFGGPRLSGYMKQEPGSPPLNLAVPVYLQPLDYPARRELISHLRQPAPEQEIFDIAGGHPWILTRLLSHIWDDPHVPGALDEVYCEAHMHFKTWKHQLGDAGVDLLQALPPAGINTMDFTTNPKWAPFKMEKKLALSMCLVDTAERDNVVLPRPTLFRNWLGEKTGTHQYDLAISYASEDRDLARSIWTQLTGKYTHKERTYRVFFADEDSKTWGMRLDEVLTPIYQVDSRFVLVLASRKYVEKYWTRYELAQALTGEGVQGRLLVLDLGCVPPEIPPELIVKHATPVTLVELVPRLEAKLSGVEWPH